MKNQIIKDLKRQLEEKTKGKVLFSILYGEFCLNKIRFNGDLDLLVVFKENFLKKDIFLLKDILINLSKKYKLPLDEEIKYKKKLLISEDRLKKIFNLSAFKDKNKFYVPKITGIKYLNSNKFLDRLFLNALTSPNIFLYGDRKKYNFYTKKAFKSLKKLAKSLSCKNLTNQDLVKTLMPPQEIFFKDYLGYKNTAKVRNVLNKGLKFSDEK